MTRTVRVELGEHAYGVHIAPGLLERAGELVRASLRHTASRVLVVRDAGVADTDAGRLRGSLARAGFEVCELILTPREPDKSLGTLSIILEALARRRADRHDPVIALGGGIIGDLAGFAAAVYRRGVPFVQCPTTLLAMVDASVGGKTGVNFDVGGVLRKNFVGAFHQPAAVLIDPAVLATLPARELRCGMAECVKHGLIGAHAGEPALLEWTRANTDAILALAPEKLTELIARNVAVKAAIVAVDEHEEADDTAGGRALLNLGHTFGHAIETIPHLSPDGDPSHAPLRHGEAVALGLIAAARCAVVLGLCDASLSGEVAELLARIGLPVAVANLPESGDVISRMGHDKKVIGGRMRLVLPLNKGYARIVANPPIEAVGASIEGIRLRDIT